MACSPELSLRPVVPRAVVLSSKDEEECWTPSWAGSRLPSSPGSCPPAPMKRRLVLKCKRKLLELDFYIVRSDEIDCAFRRRSDDHRLKPPKQLVKKNLISSSSPAWERRSKKRSVVGA